MANSQMEYPDLSQPLSAQSEGEYPDLSKPLEEEKQGNFINQLPWFARKALEFGLAGQKPLKQAVPERLAAAGAGFTHLGQGVKQLGLEAGEGLGIVPKGRAAEYTKQTDAERKFYERTPAAHDPISKLITGQVEDLPYMAALGPLGMEGGVLKKMLMGGAAGGTAGATKYVPGGEDRGTNVVQGVAAGAGIPLIMKIPGMAEAVVKKFGKAFQDMAPLEQKAAQSFAEHELAKAQESQAKGYAGFETGAESEEAAQKKAQQKRAELADLQAPEESMLPIQSSRESAANLQRSQEAHENATKNVAQAEQQIGQNLNKGKAHGLRVGTHVKEVVKDTENTLKNDYKKFADEVADHPVDMPEVKPIETDNHVLARLYEIAPTSTDITGEKALIKYKEFRDKRFALSQEMKVSKSAQERDDIAKALKATQKIENDARAALNRSFGDNFENLNSRYSDFYKLRGNSTVKQAIKHGKIKGNLLEKLSGSEEGQDLLRDIISKNPEMVKNVIGQQFALKPSGLHDAGELAQQYIGQMPELQGMIENHQNALRAAERSKQSLRQAEKTHAEVTKRETDAHRVLESQQKEIAKYVENKKKLHEDIDKLDKHIPLLKKAAQRKDVSLKEHVKAQKEYDEAKEAKKKAVKSLWKYAGGAGGLIAGSMGLKAIRGAGQGLGED